MGRTLLRCCCAIAVSLAVPNGTAQTTAGTSTTIVVPVAAQTASFVSEVTVFNPNGAAINVAVSYYDANNLATAGPKTCAAVNVPAGRSVQFALAGQCTPEAGSHFGLLVLSEQTQALEFHGYVRTQNPQGIGFSTEGFPIEHFSDAAQHATGLKRSSAGGGLPPFQTNCFVGALGQAVNYELRLFNGSTNTQIGSTLSGSLQANQQLRYLDVFSPFPNGVGAPAGNYGNVRAQFSNLTGGGAPLVGFCTVQENQSFAADFRIAKAYAASVNLPANVYVQNGNAFGTTAVLGTTDNQALDIRVNGARVMRYEPNAISPNVIGGSPANNVTTGAKGAAIGGGGDTTVNCTQAGNAPCSNRVTDDYGTVGGGYGNRAGDNDASPTNAWYATVGGGVVNTASGTGSTVSGGSANTASNNSSTVGGGVGNIASGIFGTVGGGNSNTASGPSSTVGGGISNTASGFHSTVPGGSSNRASGDRSVAMGSGAVAGGIASFAVGDRSNASGDYSVAMGLRAIARRPNIIGTLPADGSFVFADSRNFDFQATADDQFSVRATGGVRFVLAINGSGDATWTCAASNGSGWSCYSDRNLKENFNQVDGRAILSRLVSMPLHYWNAKGTDPKVRHLGPTAQDFMAAFAIGNDETMIGMQDADGVALAAIQGLHRIVREKETEIATLKNEVADLRAGREVEKREVAELRRLVELLLARTAPDARVAQAR